MYKALQRDAKGERRHSQSDPTTPPTDDPPPTQSDRVRPTSDHPRPASEDPRRSGRNHTRPAPGRPPDKEHMLIDLSDEQNRGAGAKSREARSRTDALAILDSSVAEKYQCLPPPISEQVADDPFVIKPDLQRILCKDYSTAEAKSEGGVKHGAGDGSFWVPDGNGSERKSVAYDQGGGVYANTARGAGDVTSHTAASGQALMNHAGTSAAHSPLPQYYSMPPAEPTRKGRSVVQQHSPIPAENTAGGDDSQNGVTKQQVDRAFDWLNETVAGFSLSKPQDTNLYSNVSANTEDKAALQTWDNKSLLPAATSPTYDKSRTQYCGARQKDYSYLLKQGEKGYVESTAHDLDKTREVGGSVKTEGAPPIPPRDYSAGLSPPPANTTKHYSNLPVGSRINPVMQDGVQTTHTHYWLLPEHSRNAGQLPKSPTSPTGSQPADSTYQNLDQPAIAGSAVPAAHNLGLENLAFTTESSQPGTGTGVSHAQQTARVSRRPTCSPTSPRPQSSPNLTPKLPTSTDAGFGNPREKIEQVQKEVHGVTGDESLAALSLKHWDVKGAVQYLKVEQLFRLGVASKERCHKLLETFQWNLEMAGSILLDELSMGSAV